MIGEGSAGQSSVERATVAPSPAEDRTAPHGEHDRLWTVRELADELGVSLRTLRFYEAEGLIKPRRVGTNRIYSARDRARVRLILRGKRLGMSLAECREIVEMYDGAASSERRQLQTLLERLDDIAGDLRAREEDLQRTLAEVDDVAGQCRARLAELPALS
jgi:DNA-binding transcriptional MerR regulator